MFSYKTQINTINTHANPDPIWIFYNYSRGQLLLHDRKVTCPWCTLLFIQHELLLAQFLRESFTNLNTLTIGNLHVCYIAFFAGKFVWFCSQVSDGPHNFIPERRQLVRAIQVPHHIWWHSKDDIFKLQFCPGWGSSAQWGPFCCCCHTWRKQKVGMSNFTC